MSNDNNNKIDYIFDVCVTDPVDIDINTFKAWINGSSGI